MALNLGGIPLRSKDLETDHSFSRDSVQSDNRFPFATKCRREKPEIEQFYVREKETDSLPP